MKMETTVELPWGRLYFSDPFFMEHAYEYEKEIWNHVFCPRGGNAVDIGAHQGFYTVKLAREAGLENGTVFAFEPNPENRGILKHNLSLNRLAAGYPEYALSDYVGEGILFTYPKEASGASFLRGTTKHEPFYAEFMEGKPSVKPPHFETQVKVTTLDRYLLNSAWNSLLHRLDLIKIDTEGAELRILKGAKTTLQTFNPKLVIEIHYNMLKEIASFLAPLGYQLQETGSMSWSSNPYAVFQKTRQGPLGNGSIWYLEMVPV
jgi:FkbM family methyltransferase